MDLMLKGKTALVCAASRGLGYATALALAQEGAHLAICSRSAASIEAAAQQITAQTGAKVPLVGCDLRRPSLYEMFGQKNFPGLVDLLTDGNNQALRHIANPRLDFLPAGTVPPNPAEILESERM